MKVRLKSTNEVLNFAGYNMVTLDRCDGYGNPIQVPMEDIDNVYDDDGHPIGIPKLQSCGILSAEKSIDWEQRRYEIAKEVLPILVQSRGSELIGSTIEDYAECALMYTDALIKELKKERK